MPVSLSPPAGCALAEPFARHELYTCCLTAGRSFVCLDSVCFDLLVFVNFASFVAQFDFQYVNVLFFQVVPGRVELPTSTLSV